MFSLSSTPFSLSTKTLNFIQKPSKKTLNFSLKNNLNYNNYENNNNNNNNNNNYDDEEEEHVIGDCIVFEQDAFEDPKIINFGFINNNDENKNENFNKNKNYKKNKGKLKVEIEVEDLVPEKWKEVREAINITKKERRKMAQEMEFGRRVERRLQGLAPIRNVSVEDYVAHRNEKLAQLNPIVLEKPSYFPVENETESNDEDVPKRAERVAPRNPRQAVYGGSLDDITEFFNTGLYDPTAARKTEGRRKLFTQEEKVLLNKRIPELADATCAKWLPLHTLVTSGEFYLMNTLLKHNVDINAKDKDGLTALHKATFSKKQAIFNYLLRESANPFARDDEGATLMHYAVRAASSQMIKILLLYNVDINVPDNDGWTPLHLAVQTRRTDTVRLLLIKGADKTLKNKDGLTPLDLCLHLGRDTRTYELIKLLKVPPKPRQLV